MRFAAARFPVEAALVWGRALPHIRSVMDEGTMMRRFKTLVAALAVAAAPAAQAAQDPGLTLHDTHADARRVGVGAEVSVAIPLGGRSSAERGPTLSLRAGPSLSHTGATVRVRDRSRVAPLAELALRPAISTSWSLAGVPVATRYTARALRERAGGVPAGERQNFSTLGYVAVGVVVVAVVGGLLFIDAVNDASD